MTTNTDGETKEWLIQSEIATILCIDPRNQRAILIHRASLETIKKAMRLDE